VLEPVYEDAQHLESRLDSYKRLAEVFHEVLSEQSLDTLLNRITETLKALIDYDSLVIYEADEALGLLVPVMAKDQYVDEIMRETVPFGTGITGWGVERRQPVLTNQAHLDPRVRFIAGTPPEPEALISIPLIARRSIKGALNIFRLGEEACFSDEEFELAARFGDAAALALDNAQRRAQLEVQAQTDSLTGLFNHRYFHERLRAELMRGSRTRDAIAVMILDIDDFKRTNDVFGHGIGDEVLIAISNLLRSTLRASDVVCRLGGEEFAVIMPSCDAGDALSLASRLQTRLGLLDVEGSGKVTVSIGVAQGPEHAMNPRELVGCAEAAMMTAKARGKDRVVLFSEEATERPAPHIVGRDVRSIAHLKMLQSVAGKLNRLNDVRQIANTIALELRTLIDYHNCRVYLVEGDNLVPIAFRGEGLQEGEGALERWVVKIGEGVTGRVAQTGRSQLIYNALECEWSIKVPGTQDVEESLVMVPLNYGPRVIGVLAISKLGVEQFDEADVRLLEVLAGHASVALENARLYEEQSKEAANAKALLEFADVTSKAPSIFAIGNETVVMAARLLDSTQASLWMQDDKTGDYSCAAHCGYVGDPTAEVVIRSIVPLEAVDRLLEGHREPFVITPSACARYFEASAEVAPRTLVCAPLQGLEGWITVRHPEPDGVHFSEDRLRLLAGLSYQTSVAMQRVLLYRDQRESAEIATALLEVSRDLSEADNDIGKILQRTVEHSARVLSSPRTSLWLEDPATGDLFAEAQHGYAGPDLKALTQMRYAAEIARPILRMHQPFVLDPKQIEGIEPMSSIAEGPLAVASLRLEGGRLGCLVASTPAFGGYQFSDRKMRLLMGIANQAQLAIDNAVIYQSLETTFISTVEALANALEAKDEYTSSHARWITDMALEVGHELGLDPNRLKNLELGALFHDIGKIGIPTDILMKPTSLSAAEWLIIKTHPELGERILAPIERLATVRPIVRACHEHWDGSGYPDGKEGEDIPLESRIILVVDAFHAMTSDRPYRKKMSIEEACRRIEGGSGSEFDPHSVRALLRLMEVRPELAMVE
jgi:diguanylate cyclase (GGDEF)-like protein